MSSGILNPTNDEIAELLERISELLEAQHASIHRIRAYRAGARTVRAHTGSIAELIHESGPQELERLPAIGKSLASVIGEFVSTGRSQLLENLEGQTSPADLFATIPNIGPKLAERIERELHLETLEDLEAAAHDGRLERVPGFGARRVRGIREGLGHLLRYSSSRRARSVAARRATDQPSVSSLLEMDHDYREGAERGTLRKIAPRRFNPEKRAWLPVLHRDIEGWSMTAMFSNTARAHDLGRTREWVVIYFERDGVDGQCTVVTERSGALRSKRVVRGRERECQKHYGVIVR